MAAIIVDGPIHMWFGLTYSNYLVLPRAVMQSMPVEWQQEMVRLLEEGREMFGHLEWPGYRVTAVDSRGKFKSDPIPHYNRGRTRLEPRPAPPSPSAAQPSQDVAGTSSESLAGLSKENEK